LKNFLSIKYASTDELILKRTQVMKKIKMQIKEWLTKKMEKDGKFYLPQINIF
jgi:hypothetical protein